MRNLLLLVVGLFAWLAGFSQDFSNKGKDFWLGYGYHVRFVTTGSSGGVNGQDMVLYFATENVPNTFTNIKIEIPALGYVQNINNVPAGTIATSASIPKSGSQDARLTAEGLFNTGIHVTSSRPVVAYAHIYNGNVSGATLLFPTNTLGKEYYSINYKQVSNEDNSNSFFFVVAADTGITTVEITPAAATLSHVANVPFTVSLNQGEIYNVMGTLTGGVPGAYNGVDLTGSKIRSISNGAVGCKKIAVFSGSGKIKIACSSTQISADNIFAQAFPKSAWGKRFLTAPTRNMPYNYYRIAVSDKAAVVKLNGVVQTGIINNFYYDFPISNQPQLIESDQPIMVAQYITTAGACGNTLIGSLGDPEMIYLSPVEQTIDEVIVNSTPNANITEHWINVVIKSSAVPSFKITGASGAYNFIAHPRDASYSYAQISVTSGTHTLSADSGFNAIAYGYGSFETYGYNAGTNLRDLYNFIAPLNPLNISGENTACACTPFYYSITYPFQPLSLYWDFKGFQAANVSINNPVADSTYFINGKQVWRYKLATPYTYCPAGNYPLAITAGTAGTDGCGNTQTKEDTLFVKNTPLVNFNWTHNGCVSDSVRFNDSSVYDVGTYSYRWTWEFGDGTSSSLHNPAHKYLLSGKYDVKFSLISNIGCISDVFTKQIIVTEVPKAAFDISSPLCAGKPITFSDSSSVAPPASIKTRYWDYGDGGKDTAISNAGLPHIYNLAGNYNATLRVATPSGCISPAVNKSIVINPNPVVDFTLPAAVCLPYQSAQFTDATTSGVVALASWLWIFGEPGSGSRDTAITQNPAHLYGSTGPYSIHLQVTNSAGCKGDTTKVLKNIYPKPKADFTVNAENCFTVATVFSSTSNGQGSPVSNWFWHLGDGTTTGGQNITYSYNKADTFLVEHFVLSDKGCVSDTITKKVIVNPLPVPGFTFTTPTCEKNNITLTQTATTTTGSIVKWNWNFGNGNPDSVITNGAAFQYLYAAYGTYPVKLSVETDKGCVNTIGITKNIIVSPLPKPGFISPEVCLSDASAIFSDTSNIATGNIASWSWNFGDPSSSPANNVSALQNPTHRYNAIGIYTARLILISNNGCKDSLLQSFTVNGDRPAAQFTIQNAAGYCAADSVMIKDSSTVNFGNVTKVLIYWDNVNAPTVAETDDLPALGKLYKHRYPSFQSPLSRQFTIRYKAFSGATCEDERTKQVTVYAIPKVQFTAIPDQCLDAVNYQLAQAKEVGGVPGTGVYSGAGINAAGLFTPSSVGVGTYRIKYTFSSSFGCVDSAFQNITVLAPAITNFGFSLPACETKSVVFTDSSSITSASGTIVSWSWNFGDGSPVTVNTSAAAVTHIFAGNGSYRVTLTTTSSNGCKVSVQKNVLINPLPVVAFSFPASICLPDATAIFTDASSIADGTQNAFTYLWNFDDPLSGNNTAVTKNPTHRFTSLRTYNVSLQVTSGAGCVQSATIAVNTIHPQPVAGFLSDSTSLCQNQFVRFSDNSTGADGVVNKWLWNFDNGQSSTQQLPVAQTYNEARLFTIELQIENNFGCKDTIRKPFTVFAYPVINAGPDRVLLQGGEITLAATASGNGLTYLWSPNQFISSTTILQPVVKGLDIDAITYLLTTTGAGGCRITDQVIVTLLKAPVIPNTFTPNGDGINENWTIQYLDVYPNCKIQVFNRNGQPVYESNGYKAPGWDGTYNGKPIPFGTYYYVIEPGSGRKPMTGYVTIIK
jgi:gliding motility-associated-like protein